MKDKDTSIAIGQFACLIGLDWSNTSHVVSLRAGGAAIERLKINAQPEDIHRWLDSLQERFEGQPVAIAVEASKGPVINTLLGRDWLTIYPIHPATSRNFSKAFTPSGAAHDQPDADNLLEILELHRHRLRALLPQDQTTRHLSALVESRRHIVDDRTRLGNQITCLLKSYFPQALELTGDTRYSKLAIAFLTRWPDLDSLRKVRPETLRNFYHLHHVRRPELIEERLKVVRESRLVSADLVLTQSSTLHLQYLLDQLRALQPALERIDMKIDQIFASHADKEIFQSLPGAGAAMAPRLCVLFGVDRQRWQTAGQLQKYYGIAPVIEASNKRVWTHWRWNAPVFSRQTLVEWAGLSVKQCAWAKAFYNEQGKKQKSHGAITRSLAFKWLRILFRCWKDRVPYNDALYVNQLKKKGSRFGDLIAA
jgi:transposase